MQYFIRLITENQEDLGEKREANNLIENKIKWTWSVGKTSKLMLE